MRDALGRVRDRWHQIVEPRTDGLPNRRVVIVPLAVLGLLLAALVALGITGSSTGVLHSSFEKGPDEALLIGEPQAIRSDEWFVQTSWTISQVEQGLPARNESFPGGMDATVQHDLPAWDWSLAFRPHLWAFTILPLDQAMALKWWLPAFSLVAAGYLFAVTMLPRRPVTASLLAVGFVFQPFFQWWWLSITFWPVVWALLVMATVVWLIRVPRGPSRVVLPVLTGLATVVTGMGIYVPFIIPAALVAIAFALGYALRSDGRRIRERLVSLWPLFAAGAGAVAVMVVWLATRWSTIESFTGTVYPGERLEPTGALDARGIVALFGAPVTGNLGFTSGAPLGANQSEASTFFLVGVFLLVPAVWWIVVDAPRRRVDPLLVALLGAGLLVATFMLVPGWDSIAHLLLLDRTTTGRLRLAIGLLSFVIVIVLGARSDERRLAGEARPPWLIAAGAALLAMTTVAVLAGVLAALESPLLFASRWWIVVAALLVVSVLLFARGHLLPAAVAFFAMSVIGSASVNPLYVGVYDLNDTELVATMKELDDPDEVWVGVGATYLPTVTLVQSGLHSLNGFQSSPSDEMWKQIDPAGRYEQEWNRLANVTWGETEGEPVPSNPASDQIRLGFDSCSQFAQSNVDWVLADERLTQRCLDLETTVEQGPSRFWIYRVTAAP